MKEFLWKYGLIIFLMITISILAYQKEANEAVPNQTVVITLLMPTGYIPIVIKKGLLNKNNEGKTWLTVKKYKELKRLKRKSDNKTDI